MSASDWRPVKLDELGHVGRGKSRHRPRNAAFLYGGRYPFFQTGDIKAANFYLNEYSQTYSEEGLAQSKLWKPGTLCITIAANIAESAILGIEGCFPDSVVGFVADPAKADVRFVKYYLEILKLRMQNVSHGATQDNLSVDKLLSFNFLAPPLSIQQRIAGILSTYDELIENSKRRIKILESMVRAIYREWFVHFRFPGHEKYPRVASALGDIPQGWEVKKLADLFKTVLGGTPSRDKPEFWEGGTIPWINSGKVNELRITTPSELITELALNRSAAKLMPKGTTVLAITGATLGQVSYLEIDTTANQSVVGISDPSGLCSEWIYLTIKDRIEGIVNHASGGAQQHINKEVVNDVLLAPPPVPLAKEFKRLVAPIFREVASLLFKVQNLRRTRDLLLPRLLSGQIEIGNN
ncbi:restriction endonuclease subunit S [bacterium]|nr:restriction endonuclease subunit S [bacterium]